VKQQNGILPNHQMTVHHFKCVGMGAQKVAVFQTDMEESSMPCPTRLNPENDQTHDLNRKHLAF